MKLFQANPIDEKQIVSMKRKYKGTHNHSIELFQLIAITSRIDSTYVVMRLSGYNSAPSLPYYIVLNHFMQYIFHQL